MIVKYELEAETITQLAGSSPALGYTRVLGDYVDKKSDQALLTFAQQHLKRGMEIDKMLEQILSVFHRDIKGNPIIGNWMLRKCFLDTAAAIFNAQQNKTHPKKDKIPIAIGEIEPLHINLYNGSLIKKPNQVDTYAVKVKNGDSFFKAYEKINPSVTFSVTATFDTDLINEECIEYLLGKVGKVGVGAFRERFGKFEWTKVKKATV